jgi:hypothetical protein
MKTAHALVSALVLAVLVISGCSETSNGPDNQVDHEIVTTVTFTLRPTTGGADTLVYVWEDIDGVGGNSPNRIDTMRLKSGVLYSCSVKLENRSVSPTIDITSEIEEQLDNHQFLYTMPAQLGTVTILDKDSRSLPVGLVFELQSTNEPAPVAGTFTMSLYHYERSTDKVAGVPGSETDVSIELPVR